MSDTDDLEAYDRLLDEAAEWMEEKAYARAIPLLEEATRRVPEDPEAWQRLGASHFSLGRLDAASDLV